MKRIVIFLCAVLCVCGTGRAAGQDGSPAPVKVTKLDQLRSGMRDVLRKHDEIFQCLFNGGGGSSSAAFAKEIAGLDVSGCPRSFQYAWEEYVAAWQVFARDGKPHPNFAPLAELARKNAVGITTGIAKMVSDVSAKAKTKDDAEFLKAVGDVKKIVDRYGVA